MSLGENIRNIRKNKRYSMMKINELTGLSKSTISDLENDKSSPTSETLQKLANALDVSISDFFDSDIPKSQSKNQLGYLIEQYLCNLNFNIICDSEGNIILDTNDAQYEISELDIKDLQKCVDSFIKFKVSEITNKSRKISKINNIPIAAHNDFSNDEEQQKLMKEDLDEL
ncbi:helix-turn-helix domain-containing protein [Clostridium cagae]|uniref:helix-turn-helix domain-containing protein n=1 Tax=Clostridium cagae TaxID=2080751 RepID=UPI003F76BDB5